MLGVRGGNNSIVTAGQVCTHISLECIPRSKIAGSKDFHSSLNPYFVSGTVLSAKCWDAVMSKF